MYIVVVFAVVLSFVNAENALPENFLRCHQNDNLNECLKTAVPDALRKMRKGIPEMGVPPLEPLGVSQLVIEAGAGPVVISQTYRNIRLYGLTDSTLTTYKADLKNYRLRTTSFTGKMDFVADYAMNGRILLLPIQGKGIANITLLNLVVKHDLIGEPVTKDGEVYMHLRDYKTKFIPEKVMLHFSNLFNGDKKLGEAMNSFLNQNAELVFNELKESYEKGLNTVFKDVTNKIFDSVPMNKIFLDN